ncbi:CHAT domain-containing protein [Aquabacterium sp. OR-4]|uniref:CHAT domain-containing protein n=1 Tax=Aquabacterium sp. OR-4 TaxID=2978127 RepID=UPI0028C66866|nr:CHAT domain-containing protein [Aquabacterium sp. OR-4]MDT7835658.1 CHAT domain-containing protein [Aquabacterium sp. OR-4]
MRRRTWLRAGSALVPAGWLAAGWPAPLAARVQAQAPAVEPRPTQDPQPADTAPAQAASAAPTTPAGPAEPAEPAVGPESAATLMAWAQQWQALGRTATAIWLAKRALAATAAEAATLPGQMPGQVPAQVPAQVPGQPSGRVPAPPSAELPARLAAWSQSLAGWLIDAGRLDEARALGAHERAATLARFVDDPRDTTPARPPLPLDADETAWSAAWPPGVAASPDAPGALAAWQALPQRLQPRHAVGDGARAAARATPAPARPGAALLRVHALPQADRLLLLLDDGRSVAPVHLPWPQAQREQELGAVLAAMGEPPHAAAQVLLQAGLRTLHRRFGAAIEAAALRAGAREIEVHAGGALRALPWAALRAEQGYLGERLAVRVAPLVALRPAAGAAQPRATAAAPAGPASADAARGPLRALGVSRGAAGLPALPGVVDEVCGIVAGPVHGLARPARPCGPGVLGGEGWLDEAFTAERLLEAVARPAGGAPGLLHLGTHFDLRPGRMARSSLLLGDGSRWPLARIAALDFSALQLVTLAACDTGSSSIGSAGPLTESLQDLILQRGALHVLASLWRVDDASTSALMRSFYRHWGSAPPAVALQHAQAAVRERPEWRAPFHWAGFVLAGGP